MSFSTSSSITESFSSGNDDPKVPSRFVETPRKKRYRKSIKHGLSQKRARYHLQSATSIKYLETEPVHNDLVTRSLSQKVSDSSNECLGHLQLNITSSDSSFTDSDVEQSTSFTESNDTRSLSEWSSSENNSSDSQMVGPSKVLHEDNIDDNSGYSHTGDNGTQKPIFEGCRHSLFTSYTSVMLFVMKHSLSKDAFSDLLLLIATHLPVSSEYTKSIYKVKEFLKNLLNVKEPKIHALCENCHQLLDGEYCTSIRCRNSNSKILQFHDLHLQEQLRDLFKDRSFYEMIKNYTQSRENENRNDCVKDICDGSQYKTLTVNQSVEDHVVNLTVTMNTDGVALFSSSKKGNLWPIYMAINEIPIKLRFSKKYILTSFLYCHSEKPNMLTYMSPQMHTLKNLAEEGMEVFTPAGNLLIKVHLLAVTVDLPAKAMVANMKQFNGKFGCSFCLDEGESRPQCPMQRFWPFKEDSILRTHQTYQNDVKESVRLKTAVNGVKGACPLLILQYVDIPKVFVIDWMHCVLLGVTKYLMKLWFSNTHSGDGYYVGDKLTFLNHRLQKIEIPDFVSRTQRSLEDHSHWKATECREWLLHFSVPVLEGVLPPVVYGHYMLLVSAINLLNKEKVLMDEINYAEMLLLDFCRLFPEVYGQFHQTMNVHQLKHLPQFVRLYGPLFTMSCFGFESMNAHLKSMVHGTRFINSQISFAVAMSKALPQLVKTFGEIHEDIKILAERLSSKLITRFDHKDDSKQNNDPIAVGKKFTFNGVAEQEVLVAGFKEQNDYTDVPTFKFLRLKMNNELFYSKHYLRAKTRNSFTVLLDNEDIVIIHYYLSINDNILAMVEKLDNVSVSIPNCPDVQQNIVLRKYQNMPVCHHIKEVTSNKEFKIVPVSCITKKCIYMNLNNTKTFVSIPPNLLEHN